jgi:hypothetical protein
MGSGKKITTGDISAFFSMAIGALVATHLHHHHVGQLVLVQAAWFAFLGFIYLRAKQADGLFLGADARAHYVVAVGGYMLGLLLASFAFVLPYE